MWFGNYLVWSNPKCGSEKVEKNSEEVMSSQIQNELDERQFALGANNFSLNVQLGTASCTCMQNWWNKTHSIFVYRSPLISSLGWKATLMGLLSVLFFGSRMLDSLMIILLKINSFLMLTLCQDLNLFTYMSAINIVHCLEHKFYKICICFSDIFVYLPRIEIFCSVFH